MQLWLLSSFEQYKKPQNQALIHKSGCGMGFANNQYSITKAVFKPNQAEGVYVMPTQGKSKSGSARGFAAMDAKKQREIASKGGKASHAKGTGHEFTSSEAIAAGRKGGQVTQGRRNSNGNSP